MRTTKSAIARSLTPGAFASCCLAAVVAAACLPSIAGAQQSSRQGDRGQDDRGGQSHRLQADREGWVHIAVDSNRDGRFDSVETIYLYDLERARQRSRQRSRQRAGQGQQGQQQDSARRDSQRRADSQRRGQNQRRAENQRRGQSQHRVSGQLRDLLTVRSTDRQQLTVGRIETNQGRTARVVLGPKDDLRQLNLQQGDRVEVVGQPGRINDRIVLVARRVSAQNQTVRPQYHQRRRNVQQLQGQVLNTRTVRFRGHDRPFVVGRVRLNDGRRVLVNFGPKEKLQGAQLQQQDQIKLLARQGRISGDRAWIAEQIRYQGKTLRIAPDQRRDRRWRSSRQSS